MRSLILCLSFKKKRKAWFNRPGRDKDISLSCWTDGAVIVVEEVWKSIHIEQRGHNCLALFNYAVVNNIMKK